jgi:hypothetical protein
MRWTNVDLLTHTQDMPKICVTIMNARELAIVSSIQLKWCYRLEDAITPPSEKVLEESIVRMNIKKSGRDFHIMYQLDDAEDDSSALDMVEEMREWR